jgi:hypothetical protein
MQIRLSGVCDCSAQALSHRDVEVVTRTAGSSAFSSKAAGRT